MKKSLLFLSLILSFLLTTAISQAASITSTSTPTPSKSTQEERIKNIIEKVASTTAKMDLVEIKGILGQVSDISDTQITLSDLNNNTRFIDVDELTKFSSPSAKGSFGISDIQKGQSLGILGRYNKQSRRILARFVEIIQLPKTIHGQVLSVDEENFRVEVITNKSEKFFVDIERITKTSSYTRDAGLAKSGFSKILPNERIIVNGFTDLKEKNVLIASRIILLPELPPFPNLDIKQKLLAPQETIIPSTGSGKKMTPIKK